MTKQTKEVEMNADKMTREEFDGWVLGASQVMAQATVVTKVRDDFWSRIDAIQSAPFVPDWSLKPEGAVGFKGGWVTRDAMGWPPSVQPAAGEFYLLAPSNPTDAELSAMWEKLDRDKRVKILRDAGVVV